MDRTTLRIFFATISFALLNACSQSSDNSSSSAAVTSTVIDTSYASGGFVTDEGAGAYPIEAGGPIILAQNDGKIIKVGISNPNSSDFSVAVIRYNADGTIDTTYGTSGKTLVDYPLTGGSAPTGAVFQSDGALVVSGYGTGDDVMGYVFRLDTSGQLDTSFGTGGLQKIELAAEPLLATVATNIVYDSSSSAFYIAAANDNMDSYLVKLQQADGTYDSGFATAGVLSMPAQSYLAPALALNGPDILVGGGNGHAAVWAFDSTTGSLDPAFAGSGVLNLGFIGSGIPPIEINSILVQDTAIDYCGTFQNTWGIDQAFVFETDANGASPGPARLFIDDTNEGSTCLDMTLVGSDLLVTGHYIATPTNRTGALAVALDASTFALDTSFGSGGYFRYVPATSNGNATFRNSLVMNDGKPLVLLDYGIDGGVGNGNLALVKFLRPFAP